LLFSSACLTVICHPTPPDIWRLWSCGETATYDIATAHATAHVTAHATDVSKTATWRVADGPPGADGRCHRRPASQPVTSRIACAGEVVMRGGTHPGTYVSGSQHVDGHAARAEASNDAMAQGIGRCSCPGGRAACTGL